MKTRHICIRFLAAGMSAAAQEMLQAHQQYKFGLTTSFFPVKFFKPWAVWQNEKCSVLAEIQSSHVLKIAPKLLPIRKFLNGETKFIMTMT